MKYTACLLVAMASLAALPCAWAETEAEYANTPAPAAEPPARPRWPAFAPDAAKTASRLPAQEREDRAFIRSAAASSRFEAEAARLALARSTDPRVRAVATDLIVQHNATSLELQQLLHVRAMALPMMENDHRRVLKRLGKLSGRKLDREFLTQVAVMHQRAELAQYERVAMKTADPSLKAWIDRQLPTRREQLIAAERVAIPEPRLAKGRTSMAAPPAGNSGGVVPASLATQPVRAGGTAQPRVSVSGSR